MLEAGRYTEQRDVLEGLRVIRDGLRVALRIMPPGCDEARSFSPLLSDLELLVQTREPEASPDPRESSR